jgi:predicted ABC-type ATPase
MGLDPYFSIHTSAFSIARVKYKVAAVGQTIASTFVEEESPNSAGQCAG